MTVKIDEELVGNEIHQLERELTRELIAGNLTVVKLRAAVDACLGRMGVVAPSRLKEYVRAKFLPEALAAMPNADAWITQMQTTYENVL